MAVFQRGINRYEVKELKLSENKVYQGYEENERGKNINMWKGIQ